MTELAIVEGVGVGARDVGYPVLWFDVRGDGWGALQVFRLADEKAVEILSAAHEVHDLNGRACVVSREANIVSFVRLLPVAKR